jgi:hypothetical protein
VPGLKIADTVPCFVDTVKKCELEKTLPNKPPISFLLLNLFKKFLPLPKTKMSKTYHFCVQGYVNVLELQNNVTSGAVIAP